MSAFSIVDDELRVAPDILGLGVQLVEIINRKFTTDGAAILGIGVSIVLLTLKAMPRDHLRETSSALVRTLQRFTNELLTPPLVVAP